MEHSLRHGLHRATSLYEGGKYSIDGQGCGNGLTVESIGAGGIGAAGLVSLLTPGDYQHQNDQ